MYLLYGVVIMSLSALLFRLLYVGTRLPETPWWAGKGLSHVLMIVIIGITALGVGLVMNGIAAWRQHFFSLVEMSGVAGVLTVDWLVWTLTGRMLAERAGTPVAPAPRSALGSGARGPSGTPSTPTNVSRRKAA